MSIRRRIDRLTMGRMLAGAVPETILVNPPYEQLSGPELEAHRAAVRRVAANPRGYLIIFRGDDGADPLAELLGPDDPVVTRQRGPGIRIERSYGMAG